MVRESDSDRKVVSLSLGPAGIVAGGVNIQRSLHLQYHDWGALEQDTEPPTVPRVPTALGVCVHCCVYALWMG